MEQDGNERVLARDYVLLAWAGMVHVSARRCAERYVEHNALCDKQFFKH